MSPDVKIFLMTLRRALLAEVAYIDKQTNTPAALKGFYEMSRRSNLQIVTSIETILHLKPNKSRRNPPRPAARMPVQ